jgi:hypothetical protein
MAAAVKSQDKAMLQAIAELEGNPSLLQSDSRRIGWGEMIHNGHPSLSCPRLAINMPFGDGR